MRYGWFMARNGDETGAGGESAGWLGHVCARLKAKVDEALDAVCDAPKVEGVAEAEKLARAVGVIARAARAVAALEPRLAADSEEDEMGGDAVSASGQREGGGGGLPGTGAGGVARNGGRGA